MNNVFTDYPEAPWKQGWKFFSGPEMQTPFLTGPVSGALTVPDCRWTLQLIAPETPCTTRLFSNGFSISAHRKQEQNRIDALITAPGLLYGRISGLPMPQLTAENEIHKEDHGIWVQDGPNLAQKETATRKTVSRLFSINPRHNPPVALATENLTVRLRERTGPLHGLWSLADGFPAETFSLNELYPLVRAWSLMDPDVALELVQTALNLQQGNGAFPAWVEAGGTVSPVAPWPLIAQSFELAWQSGRDPALLKKYLPALRKYAQWAVRRFDPHRDLIPAWQNEQEIFVPQSFERGKATPELTVLLILEIEAVLRLCEESKHAEPAVESLIEERERLVQTLNKIFWNPVAKEFSNVWKDGHFLHQPSFGSFMPLFWRGLEKEKQTALLEHFEETHGFPGHREPASWKKEEIDDETQLPAIHQFMALEALRNTSGNPLMLFVRRTREGFAAWFERESIEAARGETATPAYALGPITAALILTVQDEFERTASKAPSLGQQILKWGHKSRFNKTDLRIVSVFLLAILIIHLAYTLPRGHDVNARIAEAALNYQQGHFTEAMRICRRYPNNARSQLLRANLLMLAERPDQAKDLYRQALLQDTESPSALFGLALALQMTGDLKQAEKRYNDFIDIHETRCPEAAELADEFLELSREQFSKPPHWRRVYALPMMSDLRL
jgi:tetratricopeptide (TPR) repeat protein